MSRGWMRGQDGVGETNAGIQLGFSFLFSVWYPSPGDDGLFHVQSSSSSVFFHGGSESSQVEPHTSPSVSRPLLPWRLSGSLIPPPPAFSC